MRVASAIALPIETQRHLEKQMRGRSPSVCGAQRSRIVLLAADRLQSKQIAAKMEARREWLHSGAIALLRWASMVP